MPRIDVDALPELATTGYPPPLDRAVAGRSFRRLATGLDQFGVNRCTLKPGAWSSQRHWHSAEDELVYMLAGEAVLIEEGGETVLRPGDVAVFPRGVADAHHLVNRSDADAVFLAIGPDLAGEDRVVYPDVGMTWSGPEGYRVASNGNQSPTT